MHEITLEKIYLGDVSDAELDHIIDRFFADGMRNSMDVDKCVASPLE